MKALLYTIILLCASCQQASKNHSIPNFNANKKLNDVSYTNRNINQGKQFSFIYYTSGFFASRVREIKSFSLNDYGEWEKIVFRHGLSEIDSISSDSSWVELVYKDILLRKVCKAKNANHFLSKLTEYGLFELGEEEELVDKCKQEGGNVMEYDDGGMIYFVIIHGNKVRSLTYHYPSLRIKDCPDNKEFNKILKIQELFKNDWYTREH